MSAAREELAGAIREMTARHSSHAEMLRCEPFGGNTVLWEALVKAGFASLRVLSDDTDGDADLEDVCAIVSELGYAAASVPLVEHGPMAGALIGNAALLDESVTLTVPGSATFPNFRCTLDAGGAVVSGKLSRVPWARHADVLVVPMWPEGAPAFAMTLLLSSARITVGTNLAGEARDDVEFDEQRIQPSAMTELPSSFTRQWWQTRGAILRSALICGALKRVSELTLDYAGERHQFGRPIGSFQAVQGLMVTVVESCEEANAMLRVAASTRSDRPSITDFAIAKIVAGDAASAATRAAHQVHGAMGMTLEYELGQLTRRLWAWATEWGSATWWAETLGRELYERGAEALWPTISANTMSTVAIPA